MPGQTQPCSGTVMNLPYPLLLTFGPPLTSGLRANLTLPAGMDDSWQGECNLPAPSRHFPLPSHAWPH